MRALPLLRLASGVGIALLLGGCGSSTEPPEDPGPTSATTDAPSPTSTPVPSPSGPIATSPPGSGSLEKVTLTGLLEDGVETGCLVITDEQSGQVYNVTVADLPERVGQRLTVTGTVDPDMMSYCQQGTIVLVEEVTPAPESQ